MNHSVFPIEAQLALIRANGAADPEQRLQAINRVTDQMADAGLVRPRDHDSGWVPPTQREV